MLRFRVVRLVAMISVGVGIAAGARAQSAVDGFNPGANGSVTAIAVQPDGKIVVVGNFSTLGGVGSGAVPRHNIARLHQDGSVDPGFNPGANSFINALALQPDGKILVGGGFTMLGGGGTGITARHHIGRLNADGSLDTSFDPGANDGINAIAVQSDGKILVGGFFTRLGGGGSGTTTRNRIGRLNADGSIDPTFTVGVNGITVVALSVQPDARILMGGDFGSISDGTGTVTRKGIARLNADGSIDMSFDPGTDTGIVLAVTMQADGKILIGGFFNGVGGGTGSSPRRNIGRVNADGSIDASFNPGTTGIVRAIAVQPDGRIVVGGEFTGLGGGTGTTPRSRLGRLDADGSVDIGFDPGASGGVSALLVQPDGKILVAGAFALLGGGGTGMMFRSNVGRLYPDGSLDASLDPGANFIIFALAVQADGKILLGGLFTTLGGGGSGTVSRNYLGRLHVDGSLDTTFDPGANDYVGAMVVQPDGKILVGGRFTTLGGGGMGTTTRNRLARLNADGSLDTSFDPGANDTVTAIALQPDGKILVGGDFTMLGGGGSGTTIRNRLGRLNPDGSLDSSFDPGANGANGFGVNAFAIQPDGKIVVGGAFTTFGGGGTGTVPRNRLARLNPDGSLDLAFDPGANDAVNAIVVQRDGKLLVAGEFTMLGGGGTGTTTRNRLARLNADGSLDATFDPGANGGVKGLALQSDGKILIAGFVLLTTLGGGGTGTTPRSHIGRLNPDGSPDTTFDPGANNSVLALALQADGKVLAGGTFTTLGGGGTGVTPRSFIGRLTNTEAAQQRLAVTGRGEVLSWLRSGAAPELSRVTFESSADGVTYTFLGSGTRVAGGWQLTGQHLPLNQNFVIRARGYYQTGFFNASGSIVESILNAYVSINAPAIVTQPTNQTVPAGFTAAFTATATGAPVPTVQWQASTDNGASFVDVDGATATTYSFTVAAPDSGKQFRAVFTNSEGTATSTAVTLTVPPPTMSLDRTTLAFSAVSTGIAFTSATGTQAVRLTQSGAGVVTWTAASNVPWLLVASGSGAPSAQASGSGPVTLNLSLQFVHGLQPSQTGAVTLSFTGAANSAGPITVTLKTLTATDASAPIGFFDTPVDGTTGIAGSVGVTGWALDDVQVSRVTICRDAVGAETAAPSVSCDGPKVYIGDAVFVDGARPDVQAAYPGVPFNTRAGWGYLMLTNFLPNGGNGTFTLYAYALDADGHTSLLGSRTIGVDNAHATKPFGAIDTPAQGEVVCGSAYLNFGWALTQAPKDVPADSSTISAFIDGVFVGHPGVRAARSDITAAFPTSDTTHAVGGLALDTTAFTNGVHTISWVVGDTGGQTDGIGSRYFTISNPCSSGLTLDPSAPVASNVIASTAAVQMPRAAVRRMSSPEALTAQIEAAPADLSSIQGRRGFDVDAAQVRYTPVGGRITVQSEEFDRIELRLSTGGLHQYTGYLRTVAGMMPLPIGSSLDARTGAFAWTPGVGFVGTYDLVFVRWNGGRAVARQDVRIVLNQKGSNRVGPQVLIDAPAVTGAAGPVVVGRAFLLAGWAADLDSTWHNGVDAVHVWAYPVNDAGRWNAPIFLGPALVGKARADVAAVYGERFKESGYEMIVQTLPPGTYDLAVFAYSTVQNGFVRAKVVRVVVRGL
jgi:uncharacterized delta-60 repeat protein